MGRDLGRFAIFAATVACLLIGVVSILRFVGWSRLTQGTPSGVHQPIGFDDYALQFYYGQLGGRFLEEGGVTYGYDPNFMAGYPKSPIYYPSSKPYEFALYLFSGFDPGTVFNWTVFVLLAGLPLLIYGAATNFGLSSGERLMAVTLSLIPQQLVPIAGFYEIMEAAGMVPFIFASFLSVYVVSLVFRFFSTGRLRTGMALLAWAPILYLSHLTAALISVVPIAAIYLAKFRTASPRRHFWLWLVLLAIVVVNWQWVQGYILFSHYSDLHDFYTPEGSEHFVPPGGWLAPLQVRVPDPKVVSLIPVSFGVIGIYLWWQKRRFETLIVFVPQILFLFVLCFYGVHLGLNAVAPARLTLPLGLYLFFPAAHALTATASATARLIRRIPLPGHGREVTVYVALLLAVVAFGSHANLLRPYSIDQLEGIEGFSRHGMALIRWLRANTDSKGRVLHEETDHRKSHQYYGSHIPAWIPLYAGREMAGSPAPHALLQHNFLRFIAGTLRDESIEEIGEEKLASYLSLYNVRWVLAWHPSTKRRLAGLPFIERVGDFDKFTLFRVEGSPSFFLRGSGRISVAGSRLQLENVTPERGTVAVKYHWLETLRTEPPLEIEPVTMLDDPVPFISIANPPRNFVIYNDFDYGLFRRGGRPSSLVDSGSGE